MKKPLLFNAIVLKNEKFNSAYIDFPFSTEAVFGKKGQVKIKAILDDQVEYRGSLAKMKTENHILILTKDIRAQLQKTFGDTVSVKIWEDLEERIVEIPEDVALLFNQNKEADHIFSKMSYTHKKEYIHWILEAKKTETRERRKEKMIAMILAGKKGI